MPLWKTEMIHLSEADDFRILKGESNNGDSFKALTMFEDRIGGIQFLTKGGVKVMNTRGDHVLSFIRGERFYVPDPSVGELIDRTVILITELSATYYCLTAGAANVEWDGEVVEIPANESRELTDLLGKRLFISEEGALIDGEAAERHEVLKFETKDTATVSSGNSPLIVVVFYKV